MKKQMVYVITVSVSIVNIGVSNRIKDVIIVEGDSINCTARLSRVRQTFWPGSVFELTFEYNFFRS